MSLREGKKAALEAQMTTKKTMQEMMEQTKKTNHTHNLMMIDLQSRVTESEKLAATAGQRQWDLLRVP